MRVQMWSSYVFCWIRISIFETSDYVITKLFKEFCSRKFKWDHFDWFTACSEQYLLILIQIFSWLLGCQSEVLYQQNDVIEFSNREWLILSCSTWRKWQKENHISLCIAYSAMPKLFSLEETIDLNWLEIVQKNLSSIIVQLEPIFLQVPEGNVAHLPWLNKSG